MNMKLVSAIIAISLALIFYTAGVFLEKRDKKLAIKHIILFGLGLICDTTGTTIMSTLATGNISNSWHGIAGLLAIILMIIHLGWAIITYVGKNENKLKQFNKFSVGVWLIWLIPYIMGLIIGMSH